MVSGRQPAAPIGSHSRDQRESEDLTMIMVPGVVCSFLVWCSGFAPLHFCHAVSPEPRHLQLCLHLQPFSKAGLCFAHLVSARLPGEVSTRAESCAGTTSVSQLRHSRSPADTEPPLRGQSPGGQGSESRCTSACHSTVICIHLHQSPYPPHPTPISTSRKTTYLTSNSKSVVSKVPTPSHPFQVGFEDPGVHGPVLGLLGR